MKDYEKLKNVTNEIDILLAKQIDPFSEEFTAWHTKSERLLDQIFGAKSKESNQFRNTLFWSPIYVGSTDYDQDNINECQEGLKTTRAIFNVYIKELEEATGEENKRNNVNSLDFSKVFIVHGHDGELKLKVARLLEKQGIEAIILSEKANKGKTIIEKIETYAENVAAAICLFTLDDQMVDGSKRARQNVVFETGYFYGKMGRDKTIIVSEDNALNLSDLQGVVYVNKNNWEIDVLRELREIGFTIDLNKL